MAAEAFAAGGVWKPQYRICSKCGREFVNPVVRERHEERCEGVPAVEEIKDRTEDGKYLCRDVECDSRPFDTAQGRSAHELIHQHRKCQFCGEVWVLTGIGIHEAACEKNPKRSEWLRSRRGHCPHCDKRMLVSSIPYHVEHNCPVARYKRENEPMHTEELAETIANKRKEIEASGVAPELFGSPKTNGIIRLDVREVPVEDEIYEVLDLLLPDGFRARFTPDVVAWAESTAALVRKIREGA